jgi:hypothetical protein
MLDAIPQCACDDVNADALRLLLLADQRAGSIALGSVPASFLREERCIAALTGTTTQRLIDDIGKFDEEYAGDYRDGELVFDQVVTNERLLVYLCVALPDETLAWLQRRKRRIYLRPPDGGACQSWRFDPVAPGSPMGTFRREGGEPLAVHYRLGADALRLFGPVTSSGSRPGDPGPWPCDEDLSLSRVGDHSVELSAGAHLYFTSEACRTAPAEHKPLTGCTANLSIGIEPPPAEAPATDESPESTSSADQRVRGASR